MLASPKHSIKLEKYVVEEGEIKGRDWLGLELELELELKPHIIGKLNSIFESTDDKT